MFVYSKIQHAPTKFLGKNIIYYNEIDSTQDKAKELIHTNISNGTIIFAEHQTNGKGTNGRSWYTGKGNNIAMTLILFPNCPIEKLNGFTFTIAQCLQKAVMDLYSISLDIKLPNDLILNNKKIGGILTQSTTNQGIVQHLLIGIGFNVNETTFDSAIKNIATSLKKEYPTTFSREDIIIQFLLNLENVITF